MFLSPAILWGILISNCKGAIEPNKADEGLLDGSNIGTAIQDGQDNKTSESLKPRTGSAVLWALNSETPIKATNDRSSNIPEADEVTDMDLIINLWAAAGYDCPSASKYATTSPAVIETFVNDKESSPSDHSQAPLGLYVVKESLGKGQGDFAARDVIRGERILVDTPFFVVTKHCDSREVRRQFERMPILRQQQYVHVDGLYRFDDVTTIEVMRIFEVNCFNFGDRAAVFLTATRFNHSCLPNTYYS